MKPVTHVSEQCYPCPRSAHLTGRPTIPETAVFKPRGLWNTGCPAFAEHDSRVDGHDESLRQIVESHAAQSQRQIRLEMQRRHHLAHRQPRDVAERVWE